MFLSEVNSEGRDERPGKYKIHTGIDNEYHHPCPFLPRLPPSGQP